MAGSASHDPAISRSRMLVNDETMVRRVLILTNSRFQQRSYLQRRKAEFQIASCCFHALRRGHSIAVGWIKTWPTRIVRQLEAAPLISRNTIKELFPVVDPDR